MNPTEPVSRWMTSAPITIEETHKVEEAEELLRIHHVRHLPVVREGRLAGVISERDLFIAAQFAQTRGLAVGVLMALDPVRVGPDATLAAVAEKLWVLREGVAIVMDGERILGVFTAVDALRALSTSSWATSHAAVTT